MRLTHSWSGKSEDVRFCVWRIWNWRNYITPIQRDEVKCRKIIDDAERPCHLTSQSNNISKSYHINAIFPFSFLIKETKKRHQVYCILNFYDIQLLNNITARFSETLPAQGTNETIKKGWLIQCCLILFSYLNLTYQHVNSHKSLRTAKNEVLQKVHENP